MQVRTDTPNNVYYKYSSLTLQCETITIVTLRKT